MTEIKIFCPKCGTKVDSFLNFDIQRIAGDFVEVEMRCDHCNGIVAFVRIHNDEWIPTVA